METTKKKHKRHRGKYIYLEEEIVTMTLLDMITIILDFQSFLGVYLHKHSELLKRMMHS